MQEENLGKEAYIMIPIPRSIFYSFVYPQLHGVHFWHAHFGDWAHPRFQTRLIGSIYGLVDLWHIFGLQPRAQPNLSGYNTDPKKGPVCGYLLFLDKGLKGFGFSVCFLVVVFFNSSSIITDSKPWSSPSHTSPIAGAAKMELRCSTLEMQKKSPMVVKQKDSPSSARGYEFFG